MDATELRNKLGEPIAEYSLDRFRVSAGIIGCVMVWLAGMFLVHVEINGPDKWIVVPYALLLPVFASLFGRWLVGLFGWRIVVCSEGILSLWRREITVFRWEEMA